MDKPAQNLPPNAGNSTLPSSQGPVTPSPSSSQPPPATPSTPPEPPTPPSQPPKPEEEVKEEITALHAPPPVGKKEVLKKALPLGGVLLLMVLVSSSLFLFLKLREKKPPAEVKVPEVMIMFVEGKSEHGLELVNRDQAGASYRMVPESYNIGEKIEYTIYVKNTSGQSVTSLWNYNYSKVVRLSDEMGGIEPDWRSGLLPNGTPITESFLAEDVNLRTGHTQQAVNGLFSVTSKDKYWVLRMADNVWVSTGRYADRPADDIWKQMPQIDNQYAWDFPEGITAGWDDRWRNQFTVVSKDKYWVLHLDEHNMRWGSYGSFANVGYVWSATNCSVGSYDQPWKTPDGVTAGWFGEDGAFTVISKDKYWIMGGDTSQWHKCGQFSPQSDGIWGDASKPVSDQAHPWQGAGITAGWVRDSDGLFTVVSGDKAWWAFPPYTSWHGSGVMPTHDVWNNAASVADKRPWTDGITAGWTSTLFRGNQNATWQPEETKTLVGEWTPYECGYFQGDFGIYDFSLNHTLPDGTPNPVVSANFVRVVGCEGAPTGTPTPTPTAPPPPPGLSCTSLEPGSGNPSSPAAGDQLRYTCRGVGADYYQYRVTKDGQVGSPSNQHPFIYTVPSGGIDFRIQCRACKTNEGCTDWGVSQQ